MVAKEEGRGFVCGVETEQMGTNKAADTIRALSERLITTYEVVVTVTEKEAKHDKPSTPVTEVGGEMNNSTVTKFREVEMDKNTIYNSANNTVTKFRELEMDKTTIYNSAAGSMSEFSEVTSTAEDLKCEDKPKPSLRTWDQTLNDVETMLVTKSISGDNNKETADISAKKQIQTFFLDIFLGCHCSGRGGLEG
jgi:hypothetical protein